MDRDPRGGRDPARVGAAALLGIRHGNVQDRLAIPVCDQLAQDKLGSGTASLFIALVAGAAAARGGRPVIPPTCRCVGDRTRDRRSARGDARRDHVDLRDHEAGTCGAPRRLTWVDGAASGPVTAIETADRARSKTCSTRCTGTRRSNRELLLGTAVPTDTFSAPHLAIRSDGSLVDVRGDVLFHDFGTTGGSLTQRASQAPPTSRSGALGRRAAPPTRHRRALLGRLADDNRQVASVAAAIGLTECVSDSPFPSPPLGPAEPTSTFGSASFRRPARSAPAGRLRQRRRRARSGLLGDEHLPGSRFPRSRSAHDADRGRPTDPPGSPAKPSARERRDSQPGGGIRDLRPVRALTA